MRCCSLNLVAHRRPALGLSEVPGEARSGHQNWDAMPTRKPAAPSRALLTQIPTARERSCEQRPSPSPRSKSKPQDGTAIETVPTSTSRRPPWAESHAQAPARGQGYAPVALHQIKRGKSPRERRTSRQIAMSRAVLCCAVWKGSVGGHRGGAGNGAGFGSAACGAISTRARRHHAPSEPLGASPMAIDALPCLSPLFVAAALQGKKKKESIRRQLRVAFSTTSALLCSALFCFACGATVGASKKSGFSSARNEPTSVSRSERNRSCESTPKVTTLCIAARRVSNARRRRAAAAVCLQSGDGAKGSP
ncbi:hypothetical protein L1887_48969 [Cichorium endivia]|nr:hypothetical protein L1887_48969 [Cichorium endivia]